MAEQRVKTTFQFRRGKLAEWESINPVLANGEPGFAYDYHILKIGDGKTAWVDLPSQSIAYVIDAPTKDGFPDVGDSNVLYKASEEKVVYQWNPNTEEYESLLSQKVSAEDIDIDVIDGGNANG